jgi:hypothetical protein
MEQGNVIHPLFQIALDEQGPNFVYHGFVHHFGPRPLLGPVGQARVALRCAELVLPLVVDKRQRDEATRRLGALNDGFGRRDFEPPPRPPYANQPDPTPMAVVDLAHATVVHACARSRNTWRTARAAVGHMARVLNAANARPRGHDLLELLDDWILRAELETVAGRRHGALLARITAILYRSGDYPARPSIWLVRLDGGTLALFLRQGGRLLLTEGRDEDVLATVPDAHFDYAVAAARGGR